MSMTMKQRFLVSSASVGSLPPAPAEDKKSVGLECLLEQTKQKARRRGYVFNLMVAGRSGLGKSTLVNTLFKSEVSRKKHGTPEVIPSTTEIRSTTSTLTEDGVHLNLRITDTPGFGDQINNENCWEPLVKYVEDQYSKYLEEEQRIERSVVISDTRVHCCLYFIQPSGHALSSLDIEVLKRLSSIVCVIPVIAKADTLTLEERQCFRERIRADLADHNISFYYPNEDEGKTENENARLKDMIPFAVIGSTIYHDVQGRKVLGRKSKWGLVEVENKTHSDFPVLRNMMIRTHLTDLVEVTSTQYYEQFRKKKLAGHDVVQIETDAVNKTKKLTATPACNKTAERPNIIPEE